MSYNVTSKLLFTLIYDCCCVIILEIIQKQVSALLKQGNEIVYIHLFCTNYNINSYAVQINYF